MVNVLGVNAHLNKLLNGLHIQIDNELISFRKLIVNLYYIIMLEYIQENWISLAFGAYYGFFHVRAMLNMKEQIKSKPFEFMQQFNTKDIVFYLLFGPIYDLMFPKIWKKRVADTAQLMLESYEEDLEQWEVKAEKAEELKAWDIVQQCQTEQREIMNTMEKIIAIRNNFAV